MYTYGTGGVIIDERGIPTADLVFVQIAKLAFTTAPPTAATLGVPFNIVVAAQDANGQTTSVSGETVSLVLYSTPYCTPGSNAFCISTKFWSASLTNGVATFSGIVLTAAEVDTGRYFLRAHHGEAGQRLQVESEVFSVQAGKLVFVTPLPTFREGQKATVQVKVTDADGNLASSYRGSATLALGAGSAPPPASFVAGVATFVDFKPQASGSLTLTATSAPLTAANTTVTVAADTAVSYIAFSKQPTYEVTGVAFTVQPVVTAYTKSGTVARGATGTVTLTASTAAVTTASVTLTPTSGLTATFVDGVATFSGLTALATVEMKNVVLIATAGTMTTTTTPFDVYLTATRAATARVSEQSRSVTVKLSIDPSILSSSTQLTQLQSGIKNDLCVAANLAASNCNILVSLSKAITLEGAPTAGLVPAQVTVTGGSTELRELNANVIEARLGAAPRGTGILAAYAAVGRDQDGQILLAPPSGSLTLTLLVGAGDVPPGTPAGDLKVAVWDGEVQRWLYVPARALRAPDGTYVLAASAARYGVYAVVYVPGAGLISGFGGEGTSVGLGVFAGGSADLLTQVAGLHEANAVWTQDPLDGELRGYILGAPAFVNAAYREAFTSGIARDAVVLLVRNPLTGR